MCSNVPFDQVLDWVFDWVFDWVYVARFLLLLLLNLPYSVFVLMCWPCFVGGVTDLQTHR
jgi:hypothetical protein